MRYSELPVKGLRDIENNFFYTKKNISLLLITGAVSALLLSHLVVTPISLQALPFYGFSVISLALLFILRKKLMEQETVIVVKVLLDAFLTVYWINLHAKHTGDTHFYFLPVITLLVCILLNLRFRDHFVFFGIIYLTVLINGAVFHYSAGLNRYSFLNSIVYYLIVALSIWAHIAKANLKTALHQDIQSKEERIDSFVNSRKTFLLATSIVRHEIANELVRLAYCEHKIKAGKNETLPRVLEEIRRCRETIPNNLKMLSDEQPAPVSLGAVCRTVFPAKYATVNFGQDIAVEVPMLLLVSFVNNIYENAQQAYQRKFGSVDGFHVEVFLKDKTLYIEDNAGGFDVESIALGKSSKGSGHGIFLATFLNETGHLGVRPAIERIEKGIRVMMTFEKVVIRGEK